MALKIAHNLPLNCIIQIIKNVKTSSNDLVKRVLAEETTYVKESKKLMSYNEEEFYSQRDKLVEALNLYDAWGIGPQIDEEVRKSLNYKLFKSELKELKNKRLIFDLGVGGFILGAAGLFTLTGIGIVIDSILLVYFSCCGGIGSLAGAGVLSGKRIDSSSKKFLPNHLALKNYASILEKSKKADDFTHDIPFLEEIYPVKYEDSEISKLYENNAEEFMDYFSILEAEEKEGVLRLVYNSECKNEEIISWLDKNEPELVKKVGLDL
ncbi:MAG: hypothetical protein ISS23_00325 [Nanoarchaeota archaeon]|nr:hypothetical protein [Nanoarchaeota archaeon]